MTQLLIHADPGARSGLVSAWLQNNLSGAGFDVGVTTQTKYKKIHVLSDVSEVKNFQGFKIRIRPSFEKLSLQLLLFLRKNVYSMIPNFTKDEFSIETFSKVYIFAKECFAHDQQVDLNVYDHVMYFRDTFDLDKMIDLYQKVNGVVPKKQEIDAFLKNNHMNLVDIDVNSACNIAAMILQKEYEMNLLESNRLWSLTQIYNAVPVNDLYNQITTAIKAENYQSNN
jgi:hypothetical protein